MAGWRDVLGWASARAARSASPASSRRPGEARARRLAAVALTLAAAAGTFGVQPAAAGGVAALTATPPMGFNSWNAFGCDINEHRIKAIADTIVSSGLRNLGYQFVNVDDCWAEPSRDRAGKLVASHDQFPSGMRALGSYLHARGLLFGLYASAGRRTCSTQDGFPGSAGHEASDARQFARWGVDYLKYDNCRTDGLTTSNHHRYLAMSRALSATGRPIILSIRVNSANQPWDWRPRVGQLWRTNRDIRANWISILENAHANTPLWRIAGPGHWNDPDLLEVGNGRLTPAEQRTHVSLWAMMAAPLLISTDLRHASALTYELLSNRAVIALDQDPLGHQARLISRSGGLRVYAKRLVNGDVAVALVNESDVASTVRTTAAAVGLKQAMLYRVIGVWSGSKGNSTGSIHSLVPAHGTALYRIRPAKG